MAKPTGMRRAHSPGKPPATLASGAPAYFHLSRDPLGRDIAWTLAGAIDSADNGPGKQR